MIEIVLPLLSPKATLFLGIIVIGVAWLYFGIRWYEVRPEVLMLWMALIISIILYFAIGEIGKSTPPGIIEFLENATRINVTYVEI